MNIQRKLPFLGDRDYVHSTTLIDCIFDTIGRQNSYKLKCKKKILNNNIILMMGLSKNSHASFYWSKDSALSICENDPQAVDFFSEKSPYDKLGRYDITGQRLTFSQPGGLDFLCSAIALNKALLNSQFDRSENPSWFVGQLTVDDNRDEWEKITLDYQGAQGGKLFSSHVDVDGSKVAEILFWRDSTPD